MARPPIIWTDEMLDDLETYYPITRDEILAEWMKISVGTIRRKAKAKEEWEYVPNAGTRAAIEECESGVELESLDITNFKDYVKSL